MKKTLLLLALLTGCMSAQEIAQREIDECIELGLNPTDTINFANCRLQIRARENSRRDAALQRLHQSTIDSNQAIRDMNSRY